MIYDTIAYAKRCHACQIHGDFIHQAPVHLHPTSSSWPFEMWGMDVIRPISHPISKGHQFFLAITDYFSKCVETFFLKEIKMPVIKFIKHHVIYRFGILDELSMTTGVNSSAKRSRDSVQSMSSTTYYSSSNSLVEDFNKTNNKLLKTFVSKSQCDCDEKLGDAYEPTAQW